jgi:hypothetical protein
LLLGTANGGPIKRIAKSIGYYKSNQIESYKYVFIMKTILLFCKYCPIRSDGQPSIIFNCATLPFCKIVNSCAGPPAAARCRKGAPGSWGKPGEDWGNICPDPNLIPRPLSLWY